MNFDPVHIHKTHRKSYESLLYLFIPILIFAITLLFITFKNNSGQVSGASTEEILTNTPQR